MLPKGYKHTEQFKIDRRNYRHSEVAKIKIRMAGLGRKVSDETRLKISESHKKIGSPWNLGRKCSEETKKKIADANRGENHHSWIFDRNSLRRNIRNDAEYRVWVRRCKSRDKECKLKNENCYGYLVVHHIKSWRNYPELRYELKNGITVCQAHHPRKRAEEKQLEPIFMALIGETVKI